MAVQSSALYLGFAALGSCAAAVCDVRTRRIPNLCNAGILASGLALRAALEGWRGLASALLASGIAGALFLILFLAGGLGAGDVKLMAALGAVVGLPGVAILLLATAACGGLLAVVVASVHRRLGVTLCNLLRLLRLDTIADAFRSAGDQPLNDTPLYLPYGVAIAAGCVTVFARTTYFLLSGK